MLRSLVVLLAAAVLLVAACAQPPGGARENQPPPAGQAGSSPAAGPTATAAADGAEVDPRAPPRWRPAGDLVTELPAVDSGASPDEGAAALPEGDAALRQTVAARCASRPEGITEASLLRALVAELRADGVDPAQAVDALIIGRCGDLADSVTEVVAQHGADAAVPVIERAVTLTGSASALVVERAAAEGLLHAGRDRVAAADTRGPPLAGRSADYAMLYFPLGSDAAGAAEHGAVSLAQLFGNAEPGYGIYTYILPGGGDAPEYLATYRELLRVIETYVLAAGPDGGEPGPGRHTFLVAVHAGRAGAPLSERAGPDLAAPMRLELADHLRRAGQPVLAARLATAPGPFLVSSLEPRLVPGGPQAPRMIVDLSSIGPEYMYAVVDAYDRDISSATAGRVESLLAVRERLIGIFPDGAIDAAAAPPRAGDWVFMLGRRTVGRAVLPSQPTAAAGPRLAAAEPGR